MEVGAPALTGSQEKDMLVPEDGKKSPKTKKQNQQQNACTQADQKSKRGKPSKKVRDAPSGKGGKGNSGRVVSGGERAGRGEPLRRKLSGHQGRKLKLPPGL